MAVTRFGLQIPSFTYPGVPDGDLFERIAAIATTAEDAGFDSVWVMDHFYQIGVVGPPEEPMLESYTTLGGIAGRTRSINLGTMVTGVTYRNPGLLAKIVTTLDVVSGGRAILGIGAAWNDQEHAGYGFGFPSTGERMDRLEETLQICRAMFTESSPTFEGRYYSIHGALNYPRPIRPSGIPILVGGSGERRTLALVARYADACNIFGDGAMIQHKLGVLERHCSDVGRDSKEITKTKLATLVIGKTFEEAKASVARMCELRGMDPSAFDSFGIAGDPDTICEKVAEYLALGLDGLVFNIPDAHALEPVRMVGDALTRAFS